MLLSPLFGEGFISGHDNTSHYIYSLRLAEMIGEGNFRLWLPDFSMGMPLFYYYQPIPHCLTALSFLLFPGIDSLLLMKGIVVFLLTLLPLSIYQGFRWMDIPKTICLVSALLTFGIQSWIGLGFELRSILGWGLYAQLWGMVLAPLTIGYVYKSYFGKRSLFLPVTLLGILLLTHVLSGIIACLSIGLLIFVSRWNWQQKLKDALYLTKVYLGAFAIASVLLVPTLLGGNYISGYFKLDEEHHLGLGLFKTVQYFLNGNMFDYNRLPIFTLLLIGGLLTYAYQLQKQRKYAKELQSPSSLFILLNFGMAFFLIAGAQTFSFLQYTPLYNNLPFLRLLSHLHLFALPIIGFSIVFAFHYLYTTYQATKLNKSIVRNTSMGLAFLPFLALVFYLGNTQFSNLSKYAKTYQVHKDNEFIEALDFLKTQDYGRVNVTSITGSAHYYLPSINANKPIGRFYAAGNRSNLGQFYLHKFNNQNANHYELFAYNYLLTDYDKEYPSFGEAIFKNKQYRIFKTTQQHNFFEVVRSNTLVQSHNQAARHLLTYWMKQANFLDQKNHLAIVADQNPSYFDAKGFSNFIQLQRKDERLSASKFTLHNQGASEHIETIIDLEDKGLAQYLNQQMDTLPQNSLGQIVNEYTEEGYYKAELEVFPSNTQDVNALQWVLLKVNAHPDWQAKVNGQIVEWTQMSPCFMAVPLKAGKHIVEFEFGVSRLRIALLGLGFLTIIGLGLWEVIQTKRAMKLAPKPYIKLAK